MVYVIRNRRHQYIKLNQHGTATVCSRSQCDMFDNAKAYNLVRSLPKSLKRMGFFVECVPDIQEKKTENQITPDEDVAARQMQAEDYQISEKVTRWVDKFGVCEDIFTDARDRYNELMKALREQDDEVIDLLHEIEMKTPLDLYRSWVVYKKLRENRIRRREMKDELLIIHNILCKINPDVVSRERTKKAIDGLFTRKYAYRIVEVEEETHE